MVEAYVHCSSVGSDTYGSSYGHVAPSKLCIEWCAAPVRIYQVICCRWIRGLDVLMPECLKRTRKWPRQVHVPYIAGHWGWFMIASCSALLISIICGLFSFIDDDIQLMTWLPAFLRKHPFLMGFFLLHVPAGTVAACQGALHVHETEGDHLRCSQVTC
jgi:hypothetical protein